MIAIVDYGMGNTGSIKNMLKRIGYDDVVVTNNHEDLSKAEKFILPGVGSFDAAVNTMKQSGLLSILNHEVEQKKKPILGICLGMQLLTKGSEEGKLAGLGWIDAYVRKFDSNNNIKVPHIGWQYVTSSGSQHALLNNLSEMSRYYFVHSYYVVCNDKSNELLMCNYGGDFTCAIQHNNIMGVQFHPEKSHKYGMQLFRNFVEL
jgi:glutamine amidotransferase